MRVFSIGSDGEFTEYEQCPNSNRGLTGRKLWQNIRTPLYISLYK